MIPSLSNSDHSICSIYLDDTESSTTRTTINQNICNVVTPKYVTSFKFNSNKITDYQLNLDKSPYIYFDSCSADDLNNNLILAIKDSACSSNMLKITKVSNVNKQTNSNKAWFNDECSILKKQCKRNLNTYHRNHSEENLKIYLVSKKLYLERKKQCKCKFEQNIKETLSNIQKFWKVIKHLNCKPRAKCEISLEEWEQFYSQVYSKKLSYRPTVYLDCTHPYFDTVISLDKLLTSINKLKLNKAPGNVDLGNEFYKNLTPNWEHYILNMFNTILTTEKIPKSWSSVRIALVNCICKLFTQIIHNRLQNWCEFNNVLHDNQMGFRKNRSTIANIFCLTLASHLYLRLKKYKLFATFIDFRRAFDSINHIILWEKLYKSGISSKLIRVLQNLYNNAELQVKINDVRSNAIKITEGVLQGEILSPLLFALYINDIEDLFRSNGLSGINIDGFNDVFFLIYADDMVLLATSPIDLKHKLRL